MQYTVKVYERNAKKWGKLNDMVKDIEETLEKRQKPVREMTEFMTQQMNGLISRKVILSNIDYNGDMLVLKKEGFAIRPRYSQISRIIPVDYRLLNFLRQNKFAYTEVISRIHNRQKKDMLEIFINAMAGYSPKDINMSQSVRKEIIDGRGFQKKSVTSISVGSIGSHVTMKFDYGTRDSDSIQQDDWENNLIKEQLYLPFWKLLTKFKRHATKEVKRAEKTYLRIKKESEPIWVAQQIKDTAIPQSEVQA